MELLYFQYFVNSFHSAHSALVSRGASTGWALERLIFVTGDVYNLLLFTRNKLGINANDLGNL